MGRAGTAGLVQRTLYLEPRKTLDYLTELDRPIEICNCFSKVAAELMDQPTSVIRLCQSGLSRMALS